MSYVSNLIRNCICLYIDRCSNWWRSWGGYGCFFKYWQFARGKMSLIALITRRLPPSITRCWMPSLIVKRMPWCRATTSATKTLVEPMLKARDLMTSRIELRMITPATTEEAQTDTLEIEFIEVFRGGFPSHYLWV